jgi:hypothetical protein
MIIRELFGRTGDVAILVGGMRTGSSALDAARPRQARDEDGRDLRYTRSGRLNNRPQWAGRALTHRGLARRGTPTSSSGLPCSQRGQRSQFQHRAAAVLGTTMASVGFTQLFAGASIDRQPIIVGQLLLRLDRPRRIDKDASVFLFYSLAIRIATVIDPARRIAVDAGVDDFAITESENERVVWIVRIGRWPSARFLPTRSFALIFDDARTLADFARRKCTMTMGGREANREGRCGLGGWHTAQQQNSES